MSSIQNTFFGCVPYIGTFSIQEFRFKQIKVDDGSILRIVTQENHNTLYINTIK